MKPKLMLLAMFTALLSCSRGVLVEAQDPGYRPVTVSRTDLVIGGRCRAKLTYNNSGDVTSVETDPPCVVGQGPLLVNGQELRHLSGSITFGSGTSICYSTSIGPKCICTAQPCP